MSEKEKDLLFKDLCARLPYGVKVYNEPYTVDLDNFEFSSTISKTIIDIIKEGWKPYLRPMSSMTEEEIYEMKRICDEEDLRDECGDIVGTFYGMNALYGEVEDVYPYNLKIKIPQNLNYSVLDFLNAHYLDYRGLIPMGLALPAPEGMYK